jgi:hypothetical protein
MKTVTLMQISVAKNVYGTDLGVVLIVYVDFTVAALPCH